MTADQLETAHLRAAKEFINLCLTYFGEHDKIRAPSANRRALLTLFSPIMQVLRFCQASAVLSKKGLHIESQVIARSALEYAATVQYAYLRVDGLDRLAKSTSAGQVELFMQLAAWHHEDAYLTMAGEVDVPDSKGLPKVTQILDALDPDSESLHPTYAVLSQTTHVRSGSLTRYVERNGDSLAFNPGRTGDKFGNVTIAALAISAMAATWVYSHMTCDEEMLETLKRESALLGIPTRYDGHWADDLRAHLD